MKFEFRVKPSNVDELEFLKSTYHRESDKSVALICSVVINSLKKYGNQKLASPLESALESLRVANSTTDLPSARRNEIVFFESVCEFFNDAVSRTLKIDLIQYEKRRMHPEKHKVYLAFRTAMNAACAVISNIANQQQFIVEVLNSKDATAILGVDRKCLRAPVFIFSFAPIGCNGFIASAPEILTRSVSESPHYVNQVYNIERALLSDLMIKHNVNSFHALAVDLANQRNLLDYGARKHREIAAGSLPVNYKMEAILMMIVSCGIINAYYSRVSAGLFQQALFTVANGDSFSLNTSK